MSTMVEKVATAICALHYQDPSELTNSYPDGPMYPVWKDFESSARAAIEAMKEPTPKMIAAGEDEDLFMANGTLVSRAMASTHYEAMIQAALEEGQ